MKSAFLTGLLATAIVMPAQAETLAEAMRTALEESPALGAERAQLAATRQALPLAWSEALPQLNIDAVASDTQRSETIIPTSQRDTPEHWIATFRTSTLLFGSGRVLSGTRQARAQIAGAVAAYQDAAQTLLVDVAQAYGDVRQTTAIKAAQEEALDNLTEQRRYVAAHVRNGFLTQTDLAQADARLAQARADLALANARVVAANEAYMRLVGRPPMELSPPPSLTELPGDLQTALDIAARENPAIVRAQARYEESDAAVDFAASQGRLRVFLETSNSSFGRIDVPLPEEQQEGNVSLRFQIPLYSGGATRARTRQQRATREASGYELAEIQRRVHEAVTVAWTNLSAARARLEAARARVEAAELANRGIRREQEFGQRSTIDVLDQEQELLTARIALSQAEKEAMLAERVLAARIGRTDILAGEPGVSDVAATPQPRRFRPGPRAPRGNDGATVGAPSEVVPPAPAPLRRPTPPPPDAAALPVQPQAALHVAPLTASIAEVSLNDPSSIARFAASISKNDPLAPRDPTKDAHAAAPAVLLAAPALSDDKERA